MNLEQQVINLELAKRLKELGVKQESYFYWTHIAFGSKGKNYYEVRQCDFAELPQTGDTYYSAFTVAELGEMLPPDFPYDVSEFGKRDVTFSSGRTIINKGWYIMYSDPHPANKVPIYSQHADTEADARAKMLIYLLENKLITL